MSICFPESIYIEYSRFYSNVYQALHIFNLLDNPHIASFCFLNEQLQDLLLSVKISGASGHNAQLN